MDGPVPWWLPPQAASPSTFAILAAIAVASLFWCWRVDKTSSKSSWLNDLKSSKYVGKSSDTDEVLRDIWEERRRNNGTSTSSGGVRRESSKAGDRPFGSSYYYAHNSSKAKGGYTDGLRMEDYTMNKPRLLSKSGASSTDEPKTTADNSAQQEPTSNDRPYAVTSDPTAVPTTIVPPKHTKRMITKYLWDDPGDPNGIATIRIETLPAATGSASVSWQEMNAKIVNIDANLVNDKKGLLVDLESSDGEKYQLHIPKLYGDVDAVRTLCKPKRLLVRLYKKKNFINIWDKTNLEAWPHPYANKDKMK